MRILHRHAVILLVSLGALAPFSRAVAQHRRDLVAVGAGAADAAFSAGSKGTTHTAGVTLTVRYAIGLSASTRAVIDYESQPFWVAHPTIDERFLSSYFIGGIQWYLSDNIYVLPGLGVQFRHWGGDARDSGADIGAAAGFDAGYDLALANKVTFAPELDVRYALVDPSAHINSWTVGAHVVIARHF